MRNRWGNADEDKAREIAGVAEEMVTRDLSQGPQLPHGVDASHLLAGATMAVYANPHAFCKINDFLNAALTERAKDFAMRPPSVPGEPNEGKGDNERPLGSCHR